MRTSIRPELIEAAVADYYYERPVELSAADTAKRTAAIEALAAVSQEAVRQVREAKTALIAKLEAQQVRMIRLQAEADDAAPAAFQSELLRLGEEIAAAHESLAETEQRLVIDAKHLRMALELATNVAEVYEAADDATRRGYNQAFFRKLYVTPEWDEDTGERTARITSAELTEPYAVLLADSLAPAVLAEAEAIRDRAANREDDPGGSSSTGVSYFEQMAGGPGLEPG